MKKPAELRGYLESWCDDVVNRGHTPSDFDAGYSRALADVLGDAKVKARVLGLLARKPAQRALEAV